ncbi:hypothetical protein GCM10007269_05260 [Microbacterium murale]|uniref:DUF4185 domain-containing protein n=2 Tax=Microbacterium murale TaxID=1081040 RepID=A0ABQ1RDT0_9MICO|nr:hypothetical protein GCM10007269_05260 [Microbacterium murale]
MIPDPAARAGFATVEVEYGESVGSDSDGDLWPSAWADDGHLYTANGDGAGFSDGAFGDVVVNRVEGTPAEGITGERLAAERAVSPVWGDPAVYNSKPTGMLAVDGNGDGRDELYLAVQDLAYGDARGAFDHVPSASIVRSDDHGCTWIATAQPMFTDYAFTTIMFLDFGQSNSGSAVLGSDGARYAYAYGLDGNWRTSYSRVVPDPTELFLARVPIDAIQDIGRWQYFAGLDADGVPVWDAGQDSRVPVLTDTRRLYDENTEMGAGGHSVLGQGGVVYNAPLKRYFYTSWTEFTFQFYSSPQPWGPWELFHEQDFGPYPWDGPLSPHAKHGGYATTMPSKFISDDGLEMWIQSNWFVGSDSYTGTTYRFSLRRMTLTPYRSGRPINVADASRNLADPSTGVVPVVSAARRGRVEILNDGDTSRSEESWNGLVRAADVWGYTWPRAMRMDTVVLTSGPRDYTGGWFTEGPRVEVRIDGQWFDAPGCSIVPAYPCDPSATGFCEFRFEFPAVDADGIRIAGPAGGGRHCTSISELAVHFTGRADRPAGAGADR